VASRKNRFPILWAAAALASQLPSTGLGEPTHVEGRSEYRAPRAAEVPAIDGVADETAWHSAPWRELSHRWLEPEYSPADFQGRFKVVWAPERIYLLVEIVDGILDGILIDAHPDPLVRYWDDDCLELFVDEDYCGGDHQYNHNAFAYHLSLDNRAIDIGTDRQPRDYSHHVESRWGQSAGIVKGEPATAIYTDEYVDNSSSNEPVVLTPGKILGLIVTYCDNDGSDLRENFIGSESVPHGPKDRGWIDGGLFGALVLAD
jgi:hypothetical protein